MSTTTPMSGTIDRDDIEELPPAPTAVFNALDAGDEMTTQEIVQETRLKRRTVEDALGRLYRENLVERWWSGQDARQRVYQLAGGDDE